MGSSSPPLTVLVLTIMGTVTKRGTENVRAELARLVFIASHWLPPLVHVKGQLVTDARCAVTHCCFFQCDQSSISQHSSNAAIFVQITSINSRTRMMGTLLFSVHFSKLTCVGARFVR